MTDPEAITAIMKEQFDTPENPLTVEPVIVEGDNAIAGWAQGGKGGRALLARRHGVWEIVLCGGPDLRMPEFLSQHGVNAAQTLSKMYNDAEDNLGGEKTKLFSSFEGVVMISPAP
jgi:periplasmic copper chaperone A